MCCSCVPCAFVSCHRSPCGTRCCCLVARAVVCLIAMNQEALSDTAACNPAIAQSEIQPSLIPYVPFPTFPTWKSHSNVIRTVNDVFDNPDLKAVAALPVGIHRGPFGTSWGPAGLAAAKLYVNTWAADRTKGGGGFTLGTGGHRNATGVAGRLVLLRCSHNRSVTIHSTLHNSTPIQHFLAMFIAPHSGFRAALHVTSPLELALYSTDTQPRLNSLNSAQLSIRTCTQPKLN